MQKFVDVSLSMQLTKMVCRVAFPTIHCIVIAVFVAGVKFDTGKFWRSVWLKTDRE